MQPQHPDQRRARPVRPASIVGERRDRLAAIIARAEARLDATEDRRAA